CFTVWAMKFTNEKSRSEGIVSHRSGWCCKRVMQLALSLSLLTGCVSSGTPILTDAQPLLGLSARLHLYSLSDGKAGEFETVTFRWDGTHYVPVGRNHSGINAFTLHPFNNDDWIAQSSHTTHGATTTEYAYVRKLANGVHLVNAIDEEDADEATRKQLCQQP